MNELGLTFYEGQNNIKIISFTSGETIVAKEGEEIKVIMEYGQMTGVPWNAKLEDKRVCISTEGEPCYFSYVNKRHCTKYYQKICLTNMIVFKEVARGTIK